MATKKVNTGAAATPIDPKETFVSAAKSVNDADGISMEEKLRTLYSIQQTDTKIDKIHLLRGELPYEVQDLEDQVEGLKTRCNNLSEEMKDGERYIGEKKSRIEESKAQVAKYSEQIKKVTNNREYESISREIEYQELDQQACEKKIRETSISIEQKRQTLEETQKSIALYEAELEEKKKELDQIIEETSKEEEVLNAEKEALAAKIDARMFSAYNRVRNNAKNHLAVVTVKRGACGGCFNQIPPQRQLDIAQSKKIIVCEYCGRILVNPEFEEK
ncbi:MAG: hypothetical protein HUJ93_02885 [Bacteroidales bacterium]|nr:hypothetical protein [Bacteroidales bacterium]